MSYAWLFVDPVSGVVHLFGEYDIAADLDSVGDELRCALHAEKRPVLDLSGLQFADSCLMNVLAQAAVEGIEVNVQNPPSIVRRALDISGVSTLVAVDRIPEGSAA